MEFQKNTDKFSFGFSTQKVAGTSSSVMSPEVVTVNAKAVMTGENSVFKGLGCISANNSSRLLLDYKALYPEVYTEILRLLFEKDYGACLTHLKLEMGADINSSSGTEPSTMRFENETADVTRGAGFIIASDALKINPDLSIDLLRWGQPHWVKNAFEKGTEQGFKARYKWYAETIKQAYNKLGIKFTHISPDANETGDADEDWLVYFADRLRNDKTIPYDTASIKIVASDEVGTRTIAEKMLKNEALRNAVDIIGLHYTTFGDDNTKRLFTDYGKEIWYSEGIAPMNIPQLTVKKDMNGITGRNGAVDMATRVINSVYNGNMTMYEFQPAVSAYYDGSCYYPKHIIKANTPWSGNFELCSGFYTAMHFTRFAKENWHLVAGACYGDGEENHFIEKTTSNYMTLMAEDCSDITMIFANESFTTRKYRFDFTGADFNGKELSFVESCAPNNTKNVSENWFRVREKKLITDDTVEITVKPGSVLTVTTLDCGFVKGTATVTPEIPKAHRLTMPYKDDFSYKKMGEDFLSNRGNAPLYTTDQGGAFEVECINGKNRLVQQITKEIIPDNWRFRGTPDPITTLLDDSWVNYTASVNVALTGDDDSYAGIGVRYDSAVACEVTSNCGFALKLYRSGKWETLFMDEITDRGTAELFNKDGDNTLTVSSAGNLYLAYVNGKLVSNYNEKNAMQAKGRVALLSSYHKNSFANLEVTTLSSMNRYATACDALDLKVNYGGEVSLNGCDSYKFTNRTSATMKTGATATLSYKGFGFALCGSCETAKIKVELDGAVLCSDKEIGGSLYRQSFYRYDSCGFGWHNLKITVTEGEVILDSILSYSNTHTDEDFDAPLNITEKQRNKTNTIAKAVAVVTAGAVTALIVKKAFRRKK